ncbi:MAG TPA: hypothetical protein LFV91_07185, partial [Rickettsia endosymbiont of Bembidion nr. Transversale]|nr:hypothetical protein [Rickettsia endosymbiont of Bembidion nr. Transversale]
TREHIEDFTTNDITEEFKMFKEQGYDFAATREVLQNRNQDTNQSPKSIFERMKELSISGYISRYAGDDNLRQDIEEVMHKKEYVMQELRLRVSEFPAFEFKCNQLEKVDILGEH